jgi:RNA polymerase primary sigma factor
VTSLDHYLKEIGEYSPLDPAEEAELARRSRAGDADARDAIVTANLRFVVSIAKKFQNRGVALEDLVNEGNIGLLRALEKFDETRGVKFISYAVWWVRQAVRQAVADQGRIVRLPARRAADVRRISRRSEELRKLLEREPTVSELAADLEIPEAEVQQSLRLAQAHVSIDAPMGSGDMRLRDYLPDQASPEADEKFYETARAGGVDAALATLKEREALILRLYYGLDGEDSLTLEEIGARLGVTRERIRQLKERGLARLRHASRARDLETFLGE